MLISFSSATSSQLLTAAKLAGIKWENFVKNEHVLTPEERKLIIAKLYKKRYVHISDNKGFIKPLKR